MALTLSGHTHKRTGWNGKKELKDRFEAILEADKENE